VTVSRGLTAFEIICRTCTGRTGLTFSLKCRTKEETHIMIRKKKRKTATAFSRFRLKFHLDLEIRTRHATGPK